MGTVAWYFLFAIGFVAILFGVVFKEMGIKKALIAAGAAFLVLIPGYFLVTYLLFLLMLN